MKARSAGHATMAAVARNDTHSHEAQYGVGGVDTGHDISIFETRPTVGGARAGPVVRFSSALSLSYALCHSLATELAATPTGADPCAFEWNRTNFNDPKAIRYASCGER